VIRRIAILALVLAATSPLSRASGGPCPGTPLICVGAGSQTLVVAVDLPPQALGILVAGPRVEPGPTFGSGRWCIADPCQRLATVSANLEGTAIMRLEGRPHEHAGSMIQLVWRDRLSGMTGSTGIARLSGG